MLTFKLVCINPKRELDLSEQEVRGNIKSLQNRNKGLLSKIELFYNECKRIENNEREET